MEMGTGKWKMESGQIEQSKPDLPPLLSIRFRPVKVPGRGGEVRSSPSVAQLSVPFLSFPMPPHPIFSRIPMPDLVARLKVQRREKTTACPVSAATGSGTCISGAELL